MTGDDVAAAIALRLAVRENVVSPARLVEAGVTEARLRERLDDDLVGWVADDGKRLIGFTMGDVRTGELQVLAVDPEAEGRGVGSALLAAVTERLFDAGHDELWLLTSRDPAFRAYRFYQRHGWRPTGRVEAGDERFVLTRPAGGPLRSSVQSGRDGE